MGFDRITSQCEIQVCVCDSPAQCLGASLVVGAQSARTQARARARMCVCAARFFAVEFKANLKEYRHLMSLSSHVCGDPKTRTRTHAPAPCVSSLCARARRRYSTRI